MSAYSFLNIHCNMVGPGIAANLGSGAAVAEEGISIEPSGDKNVMTEGADGKIQHSLIASDACTVTVRLLKTSPLNAALMIAYDLQTSSSAFWGINQFIVSDSARGDISTVQNAAFKKKPVVKYGKEGDIMEWTFDGAIANTVLGSN